MKKNLPLLPLLILVFSGAALAEPKLDITVEVDFGKDLGQNFGTLFEGRDESGKLLFGAGFEAVFNTYYRGERNRLQFFVRPQDAEGELSLKPFPRPEGMIPSTYVYPVGEDLFVDYKTKSDRLLKYDPDNETWVQPDLGDRPGISASMVRGKRLEMVNGDVVYDGKVIFDPPDHPIYRYYYYGQGHLFFYRETKREIDEIQKAVVAIPWTPYDEPLEADIEKEIGMDIFMPPEFPYSYGQLGDEVITCSNWGGLYAFDGESWKVLRKPEEGVSYQVYTMITYGDRLLMGQYPTGYFIEYDGEDITVLEGWPPVPEGASPSARELQTAAIYRGELFAGVWPWAELWRMDPDSNEWDQVGRLFTHPEVHDRTVHPNEEAAKEAGLVMNQLGQRLTSMVPFGDGLVMGTSWKGGETVLDPEEIKGLTKEQLAEFGALHFLEMPGNLEAVLPWSEEPVTLRFVVDDRKMAVFHEGEEIASAPLSSEISNTGSELDIHWGDGVFGALDGKILEHHP
ncbi:MAG: hypothetical protein KC978_12885 [Candidatus Omnitrophica bacterium]|nr:hypothetical protein [Candidatus Omnitrophota bacterium]